MIITMLCFPAWAVPGLINFQGKLTDADGNALNGTYTMEFTLYDRTGWVWNETQTVAVENGIYNVKLGAVTPLNAGLFSTDELYLGIIIDGEIMSPRQRITSMAYAMRAEDAEHATSATNAEYATSAGTATSATNAEYATNAGMANTATSAANAEYATSAGDASHAADADHAVHAETATTATTAGSAATAGYADRAGDAETLDGLHASYFLSASSDYGRNGVSLTLYEGSTALTNKYVNQSGDDVTGRLTASVSSLGGGWTEAIKGSLLGNSAVGAGVYGYTAGSNAYGVYGGAIGTNGVGVFGEASGTTGYGVYGKSHSTAGWAGYFEGKVEIDSDLHIPSNSNIINNNGREVFHTGWSDGFGDYTSINSGYDWGSDEPVSVVAGSNGVFFTKGDESGTPYAETLMAIHANGDRLTINDSDGNRACKMKEDGTVYQYRPVHIIMEEPGRALQITGWNIPDAIHAVIINGKAQINGFLIIDGDLDVNGLKYFIQPHSTDPAKQLAYVTLEGPESAIFLRGTAKLLNGEATIQTPDYFRMAAGNEGVTVQFTPRSSKSRGLAAVEVTKDRVRVAELMDGKGTYEFDYFITAKRAGFEKHEPIQDNTRFTPEGMTREEFEKMYSKSDMTTLAMRNLLISNGTLTKDGELNMEVVEKIGWKLKEAELAKVEK
jgi:hypothetical protein